MRRVSRSLMDQQVRHREAELHQSRIRGGIQKQLARRPASR